MASTAQHSGRSDDNVESIKLRFDTFKAETLPTVELFKQRGRCVEIDTSKPRDQVYEVVREQLAEHTDAVLRVQSNQHLTTVLPAGLCATIFSVADLRTLIFTNRDTPR